MKNRNSIATRCLEDSLTSKRLKYNPFYNSFDRQVGSRVWREGKEYIMFCSNDYLGLSDHPKVIEAAQKALSIWGTGTTGGRPLNGSRAYHEELEARLAHFLGKESCHVFAAGYLACMASLDFACSGDLIVVDRNVHSSLWTGICLAGTHVERFSHNDVDDLLEILNSESVEVPKIVVVEGVYSMEGHIAPLDEMIAVSREKNCFFIVDDAHSIGVLGNQGRGTADYFNVTEDIDIIVGSFSKSFASTGGYIAGDACLIEYMRTHSKQTIFSAAISPAQAACAMAVLDILENDPEPMEKLWRNTKKYRSILNDLGYDTWGSQTPAIPIVIGTPMGTYEFWKQLKERGIHTGVAMAPGVPPGKDLIRTAVSARHTDEDINIMGDILAELSKNLTYFSAIN